ncbi:MAG: hypothetical protein J6Z45_05730 [Oscillospiraceae bacterium]|nr:hypothetical protein [Oscillospiraceae bacterium]
MKTIRILSESSSVGVRLRDILYQAGYPDIRLSVLTGLPPEFRDGLTILYARQHITDIIRQAEQSRRPVILLLNPDQYALQLDRARHAGIRLLLMPVDPFTLLESVQEAVVTF